VEDGYQLLHLLVYDLEAIHGDLDLWVANLDFLQSLSLLFELILNLLEVFNFIGNFRASGDLIGLARL
jgi:hypothetical protein